MNGMSDKLSSLQPLIRDQRGFAKIFIKLMGVKPFAGGEIAQPNGTVRLLSGYTSAYLIPTSESKEEFILIDAGVDPEAEQIKAALYRHGVDEAALKAIFITHGHSDHVGGVNQFPEADVYIGEGDKEFMLGHAAPDDFVSKLKGKQPKLAVKNPEKLHAVNDKQTITIGKLTVTAIAVPGHTKGSTAYVVGDALFVGDALTFDTSGKIQAPPAPVSDNLAIAAQSVRGLLERIDADTIPVAAIIPSHSGTGTLDQLREYVTNLK